MESLLEGMAKEENSDKSGSQCSGMISAMVRGTLAKQSRCITYKLDFQECRLSLKIHSK